MTSLQCQIYVHDLSKNDQATAHSFFKALAEESEIRGYPLVAITCYPNREGRVNFAIRFFHDSRAWRTTGTIDLDSLDDADVIDSEILRIVNEILASPFPDPVLPLTGAQNESK